MPGRSVRIFLVDGTPQGIRTAEVGNWSGLAAVSLGVAACTMNLGV
ncbi:MAG: hypothetical protein HYZ89_01315 [Candidatus Omnitrophica bacterium]|nr:hypothetical protein [Candidatus Omnitrophota bacterium]